MSDGISVISDGDGHNTPPESDATADIAAERVSEDQRPQVVESRDSSSRRYAAAAGTVH